MVAIALVVGRRAARAKAIAGSDDRRCLIAAARANFDRDDTRAADGRYFAGVSDDPRRPDHDQEPPEERAFDYARTVALSDGVFAIALTLLVLNITLPEIAHGHESELGRGLLDRAGEFESYALSFAVISLLWIRHHNLFRVLERIDTRLTVLNLVYLGFIAFLPYPTRVIGTYGNSSASVVLYATSVAIVTLIAGAIRVHVVRADLLTAAGHREIARREHWALAPAIFLGSIPIALVSPNGAVYFWLLLLLLPMARRAKRRRAPG